MVNWRKGVQGPQRKYVRRTKRAKRAVDRRQNRNIAKLYKMVKYSKERKWVDQGNTLSLSTSYLNMLANDLTYIRAGDSANERNGNKIKIHSHHIKVVATVGDSTNWYRFLVIRFSSQPASLVQISDALDDPTAATPFQLLSMLKRNTDCRYQILHDTGIKLLAGNGIAASTAGPLSQRVHNIYCDNKGKGYYAAYSGVNAGDVTQGYTYLIGVTDSAIAPQPVFNVKTRTIFSG